MNSQPPPRQDRLRLLSVEQVARFLGTTVQAIYRLRARGDGPPGYRIGRHVRYRSSDVEAWLADQADDIPRPHAKAETG